MCFDWIFCAFVAVRLVVVNQPHVILARKIYYEGIVKYFKTLTCFFKELQAEKVYLCPLQL